MGVLEGVTEIMTLKNYISSDLNVNITSAISLDRDKSFLSYDISLFMNRRLVPEISLFS